MTNFIDLIVVEKMEDVGLGVMVVRTELLTFGHQAENGVIQLMNNSVKMMMIAMLKTVVVQIVIAMITVDCL